MSRLDDIKNVIKNMLKDMIIDAILILLIVLMAISSIRLYKALKEDKEQRQIFDKLQEIVTENTEETEEKNKTKNLQELYNQNNDFVGWIHIEDTNINYPVMQSKDRENYYLKRNFYKEYSSIGTPYIAENCDINTSDNLIIYGHHIKNNTMFGQLEEYKKRAFYADHKTMEFNTLYENANYEIIAVFKTSAINGFKYYKFYNAKDEQEFNAFINKCKELSFYDIQTNAKYGDKLITLSTCEYSQLNGRLVVVARKIT